MTSDESASVKYLGPAAGRPAFEPLTLPCYFQNMKRYSWHLQFLQSFPGREGLSFEAYTSIVLNKTARRLWGGAVTPWPNVKNPSNGKRGIVAYSIYADVNTLDTAAVHEVFDKLKTCMPFAENELVFVPENPDQIAFLTRERAALAEDGIASLFPGDLTGSAQITPYSQGEGYGTLRVMPEGAALDDYGPRDVVVVESVPNDISVVAGLISKYPQNELGHVNLRLREKGVPNASMPAVYDSDFAHDLDGKLVHVVVTDSKVAVTVATLDDAQAYWDAHQPHVGPILADLSVARVTSFDTLRAADKTAFGAKAANLGELTRVLDVPARNDGFAIPFAAYAHFMTVTGLDAEVESLLADPALRTDASVKHRLLKTLRDDIKSAPFPPELVDELRTMIAQVYGDAGTTQMLRYRSSTNVEDLDAFTGAGLYDSKSGCLADELDDDDAGPSRCLTDAGKAALESELARREAQLRDHPEYDWLLPILDDIEGDLANEKATSATIRKVWASLWNERAFDEREYYGIDHRLAYMGIAVNPTFVVEQASAVALSNLAVDDGAPLYQLNSQAGSESVVRPEDPTTAAELLTFRREGEPPEMTDVDVQVSSNLVPDGGPVWPANKLTELGSLLFRVHDYFAQNVYADISPLHLDFEVKLDAENHVVIKQVRPFVAAP